MKRLAFVLLSFLPALACAQTLTQPDPLDFEDPRLPPMNQAPSNCPEPGNTINNTCLQFGRFEVEAHWADNLPVKQIGISESSVLGYYFDPDNLEMMVKVLDGCSINGHYWVFFAAMTDQKFQVDVRDYQNRTRLHWEHLGGAPTTVNHTQAFPCN